MWRLLSLLALWLGTMALGRAELTAVQRQGLQVALEEFHKHPRVQWAFQKTSVDSAMDMVSSTTHGGRGLGPHSQETSTFPGSFGLCEHPAPWRKATTRPPGRVCRSAVGRRGRSRPAQPTQRAAGLPPSLSAALPRGDVCEAGVQAAADQLREEGMEESGVQSQAQRGE